MAKKRVYRYKIYDIHSDDYIYTTRMATRKKIDEIGASIIPDTELTIDESLLEDGWTKKDFDPGSKQKN